MKMHSQNLLLGATAALIAWASSTQAQTVISGPNIMTSNWSPAGSPYIVTANCTVPSGQKLTIQPGTVVWISSGISLTANGMISAVGTAAQRITFQAPINTQTWNTIRVNNTIGTNHFKYCDFSNADIDLQFHGASQNEIMYCSFQNARHGVVFYDNNVNNVRFCNFQNVTYGIWMTVGANNWTQTTTILNCTFTNTIGQAIYGEAYGAAEYWWSQTAQIASVIKNCSFSGVGAGCRFNIWGGEYWRESLIGSGYGNLQIVNNVFCNVTNSAIWLSAASYAGGGSPTLMNNTVINAGSGVVVQDPWDAKVQSSLFVGCTNGVTRSGSLSATVSYNGFYSNTVNFTGYPSPYGMVILANRNGTPSDVLYNIFSNPLFVATNDFHVPAGSPAIDAGTPDWNYTDMCFSNSISQGSSFPDLGAYGGPDAVNWLDVVPVLPAQASLTKTAGGIIQVNWGALPRSEYQVQWTSNVLSAATTNWFNVSNGRVRATAKPTSVNVATNPPNAERYYRVQSFGRAPGN